MADCVNQIFGVPMLIGRLLGIEVRIKETAKEEAQACVDEANAEAIAIKSGQIYRVLEEEGGFFSIAPILGCEISPLQDSYTVRRSDEVNICWKYLAQSFPGQFMQSVAEWDELANRVTSYRIEIRKG